MGRTRKTRRPWRVVTVVGAACTAACQLISGVDSLDVRDTTPALDASSDASTEGGGPDATQEGAADAGPESSPGKDAGADAGLDASMDGSGGSTDATTDASSEGGYCQSLSPAPYFCADFNEDPDASAYWSSTSLSSKSTTLALTSMYAASAPRSSLSWAPTAPSFAYGEADFNSLVNPGTFTFAFDALIVTGDTSPNADLYVGEVDFVPWSIDIEVQYISSGKYSVDLWEVWYVADAGYGVATHAASGTIDTGAWTHFVLVLQTPEAGTSGTGSLSMNNKQVATFVTSNMPSGVAPFAQAGVVSNDGAGSTGWAVAVDNVTFDVQ